MRIVQARCDAVLDQARTARPVGRRSRGRERHHADESEEDDATDSDHEVGRADEAIASGAVPRCSEIAIRGGKTQVVDAECGRMNRESSFDFHTGIFDNSDASFTTVCLLLEVWLARCDLP